MRLHPNRRGNLHFPAGFSMYSHFAELVLDAKGLPGSKRERFLEIAGDFLLGSSGGGHHRTRSAEGSDGQESDRADRHRRRHREAVPTLPRSATSAEKRK